MEKLKADHIQGISAEILMSKNIKFEIYVQKL
jgi:hypothetical protein